MKNTYLVLLFVFIMFSSCDKQEIDTYDFSIALVYPDNLHGIEAKNMTVKIQNTTTGNIVEMHTNDRGLLEIKAMSPGVYNFSGSRKVTKEECLKITGISSEIDLSFSLLDFPVNSSTEAINKYVLKSKPRSSLLISEIYDSCPIENALKEAYIELYNNSDEAIALDGLCIATLGGPRGPIDGEPWKLNGKIYAETYIRIPGNGNEHVVQPGEFFLIAANAKLFNYKKGDKELVSVDLNTADMEVNSIVYNNERGLPIESIASINTYFDFDNPSVDNAEIMYLSNTWWFLFPGGSSTIIFRTSNDFTDTKLDGKFMGLGISFNDIDIIDAVDFLKGVQSSDYKRLPDILDSGFTFLKSADSYLRKSVRRKREINDDGKLKLVDTNNSSNDFEEIIPSPSVY